MNPKDLVGAKKAPLQLVPPSAEIAIAEGLQVGAEKYGPFNWREVPVEAMTYIGALRRHIDAWVDGQELAEDSGVKHLSHALAGLAVLVDAIEAGSWVDNRPPKGPAADLLRRLDKTAKANAPLSLIPRDLYYVPGQRYYRALCQRKCAGQRLCLGCVKRGCGHHDAQD